MSDVILKVEGLCKAYLMGRSWLPVLKGVSLSVRAGEFVAIVGASGSGKSTLLHVMGALDKPDKGRVIFQEQDVFALKDSKRDRLRNRAFGFVYQFYRLLPELNVLENVLLVPMIQHSVSGWFKHSLDSKRRCRDVIVQMGLEQRLKHRPGELSGGEQQRVAICRALANQPSILLADEPTGNLDKRTGGEVLKILKDLHRAGQTIVMVTHDTRVADTADRTVLLEDGQLRTV